LFHVNNLSLEKMPAKGEGAMPFTEGRHLKTYTVIDFDEQRDLDG
jgi:hypothetical protein